MCGSGLRVPAGPKANSAGRPWQARPLERLENSHGEPTEKIARAIVRGIDRRSTFLMPSWRAWTIVTLAHWLPGLFDAVMTRWGPSSYKDAQAARKPRRLEKPPARDEGASM